MAETDDRTPADATADSPDAPRPLPASPPVIDVTDAEDPAATTAPDTELPAIDSSLVGEGGLPAATRKAEEEEPDRTDATSTQGDTAAEPFVADAPDPGPTRAHGTPPVITTHAQPAAGRRGGFWPLVLGGVVAAGLGSAATIWTMPQLRTAPAAVDGEAVTSQAVEAARAEVTAQLADVMARASDAGAKAGAEAAQSALAAAPREVPADNGALAGIEESLAALEDLQARVAALEARPAPEAAAPQPPAEPAVSADEIGSLREQLTAQAVRIEELAARPQVDAATLERLQALAATADEIQQRLEQAADAAEQRLAATEDRTAEVEQKVAEATRRTQTLAALTSLQATLQTGGDREAAVQGLAAAGIETPDELAHDAPPLEELQQLFPAAAREGLAAALRDASAAPAGGGFFTNFLRAQTGARSLEPRPGNDPDAVLSRAGDAVQRGDIAAALTELQALPPAGREAMADWLAGAEAWVAASDAVSKIEDNLK